MKTICITSSNWPLANQVEVKNKKKKNKQTRNLKLWKCGLISWSKHLYCFVSLNVYAWPIVLRIRLKYLFNLELFQAGSRLFDCETGMILSWKPKKKKKKKCKPNERNIWAESVMPNTSTNSPMYTLKSYKSFRTDESCWTLMLKLIEKSIVLFNFYANFILSIFFLINKNLVWSNPFLVRNVLIIHSGETTRDFFFWLCRHSYYLMYWALLHLT